MAGIFLAIPVVAILTVSYRHWMEHRGSEGLADLLEPTGLPATTPALSLADSSEPHKHSTQLHRYHMSMSILHDTTPEEMARARPDLTTGELKMPE